MRCQALRHIRDGVVVRCNKDSGHPGEHQGATVRWGEAVDWSSKAIDPDKEFERFAAAVGDVVTQGLNGNSTVGKIAAIEIAVCAAGMSTTNTATINDFIAGATGNRFEQPSSSKSKAYTLGLLYRTQHYAVRAYGVRWGERP